MKLSYGLGSIATTAGSIALLLASAACSSSTSGPSTGGGSTVGEPPPAPTGASASTIAASHNYALHKLYLGDTDRTGATDGNAWKSFGYNLDGKVTTDSSTDVCQLAPGASKSNQVDGNSGIDNSFGSNIMQLILTVAPTASQTLNTDLQGGSFSIFTYVTGFNDAAGNKTTATGLKGVLLAGGKLVDDAGAPVTPTWDKNTNWPVLPDLVQGCTSTGGCPAGTDPVAKASVQFPSAFQTNGTFVNGTPAALTLSLSIGGQSLSLNIASAVITFDPAAPGSVTNGTIAGVLDTTELINGLRSVAGNISPSLCAGSAFDSIASSIQQASDIQLDNGKVANNAGSPCNAISIGLGFDSSEIAAPSEIAPGSPPAPSKCADAGTD